MRKIVPSSYCILLYMCTCKDAQRLESDSEMIEVLETAAFPFVYNFSERGVDSLINLI